MILEILITIFGLFAIGSSFLRLRKNQEPITNFLMWTFIWLLIIIVVLYPSITSYPADILNIERGIDVFVYLGILVLFYLIYKIYTKIEKLEQEITIITRRISQINKKK